MTQRPAHLAADLGAGTPSADVALSEVLVAHLIATQFPLYTDQPIRFVAEGWDNAMFRVGEHLCARLPRRHVGEDLLKLEQRWLGQIAPRLTLPIPAPIGIGLPDTSYPYTWSLVPWMPGEPIGAGRLEESEGVALGSFLKALHIPASSDAPISDCRGLPLATRIDLVEQRSARLIPHFDWIAPNILPIWADALAASTEFASVWLHGDLHPRNVLMDNGKLSAVIDWGDMCGGDPATDLAALWMLLPNAQSRALAVDIYKPSIDMLRRAKGWAITWGLLLLDTGRVDNDLNAQIGLNILEQVLVG
jgi:aminoglycoside phosphotransferase (APT) family kinase protein